MAKDNSKFEIPCIKQIFRSLKSCQMLTNFDLHNIIFGMQ